MGQFLDYQRPNRQEWKFTYKGHELLEPAKVKLARLTQAFEEAQANVRAAVAKSVNMRHDEDVEKYSKQIEQLGPKMEECQVFVWEFGRNPDRDYNLSISDVTYFNLHIPSATILVDRELESF